MIRWSMLVWMVVIVVSALMLYRVKYEVQNLRAQIAETQQELELEKESLHVVAAEWAYLNRPERLQALAGKYLSASGMTVEKIAEVESIPFPKHLEASVAAPAGGMAISPVAYKEPGGEE